MSNQNKINEYWLRDAKQIFAEFDVDPEKGLDSVRVEKRRWQHGLNRLRIHKPKNTWKILLEQFKGIIVGLLIISAILSFLFRKIVEGVAIVAVVLINAAIGFFTELRAVRSMEALREISSVEAKVLRNGEIRKIPAERIVPGDIVELGSGDIVTADLRLVEASKLQANESALTGEADPVSKHIATLEGEIPLAERTNMLFKGTSVIRGSGFGLAVATGMETELGKISALVAEAEEEHTPLEDRLAELGQRLVWITLGIIAVVALVGILRGKDFMLMIETAVALAVAAVPEGLPIVATIALARGMSRMARHNALINRLASVETLGSTTIICVDKTGTLTENQMTLSRILLEDGEIEVTGEGMQIEGEFTRDGEHIDVEKIASLKALLSIGILCNNASLQINENNSVEAIGEPLEVALLLAGIKAGLRRDQLINEHPEVREEAFDPEVKMMATFHKKGGGYTVAVKGGPEAVLGNCTQIKTEDSQNEMDDKVRKRWLERNIALASDGYRMLAMATRQTETIENPYKNLTFLGLVALRDPPREDVGEAIQACKEAGLRVVMVTGDQPSTAENIAHTVALVNGDERIEPVRGQELKGAYNLDENERQQLAQTKIFARVSPKQKLDLIALHQQQGDVVAMTGDGVNDAPALKKADIGIAMGQRGTQVAREAADMVLEDDKFSTIVLAIRLGRVIFNNIRRFVVYLISCNVSEILVVFLASLLDWPLPIRPLQILFLNLVTDVFPALALGVSDGDPQVMQHKPRKKSEPVLTGSHWAAISGYSLLITASVLGVFALAAQWLRIPTDQTVTISFLTLALAQLWHVFNMRDKGSSFFRNDIVRSPSTLGALALCVVLLLIAIYIPGIASLIGLKHLGVMGWALALGFSLIPWIVGQTLKQNGKFS